MRLRFSVGTPRFWLGLLLMAMFSLPLAAQSQATLAGYVKDPSGASIPGATIKITNEGTGISRAAKADAQGRYFIPALNPGTYDVDASAKGFKAVKQTGLVLNVGAKAGLNLQLQIGSNSETVTVAADAAHVQTESGEMSDVVSGAQIQSIAVNGRNFLSLATLVPGASSSLSDTGGVGHLSNNISFNGSRQASNSWLVDGAQDVDAGSQGSMMTSPAMDAVGEFRVVTSNYSAEYGNASGAVVDTAIKSGTNQFHGSAYEFIRNDALDARNAFDKNGKSPLKLNDFGFTVGGPIKKDKTFFFYSQEWRRDREGKVISAHTPSPAELAGDFSAPKTPTAKGGVLNNPNVLGTNTPMTDASGAPCVAGLQVNPNCFDKQALALLQSGAFPVANAITPGQFNNYSYSPSVPTNYHQELLRVDHSVNSKLMLMGHYIHEGYVNVTPTTQWGSQTFPTINTTFAIPSNNLLVKLTQIVNPTLVNELSFGLSTDNETAPLNGAWKRPSGFTAPELYPEDTANRIPTLGFSQGYGGIDAGRWPLGQNNNQIYTFNDMVTQTLGRHTIKYGGFYEYQIKNQGTAVQTQGAYHFDGSYTGNALADLLLGLPNSYSETDKQLVGHYRFEQVEGFVQDDFHVSPSLTLNLGVRWSLIPHVYDKFNQLSTFLPSAYVRSQAPQIDPKSGNIVPGTGNLLNGIVIAGQGIGRSLTNTYYNNWGPRIGFSWDPSGHGTTVLRGGYGVGYYREQGNDTYDVTNNPPFAHSVSLSNPSLDNPAGGAQVLAPPSLSVFNPEYKIPMSQQYSLGVQRQLPGATILTISYVGSHSTHLTRTVNLNQPSPIPGYDFDPQLNNPKQPTNYFRPYLGWGSINARTADGSSEYNSLQANLEKQMTHNLRFQAAYTWSKSMDNASNYGEGAQNPYNRASEWALSDFDRTQVLQVNYIYDLPFFKSQQGLAGEALGGWEVAGVTTFQSGTPLTIGLTGGGHGLASRPDATGAIAYPKTVAEWFNTSIYAAPALGFYGNSGRNTVRGPGMQKFDVSLYKSFLLGERIHSQVRVEGFNVFNHVNYSGVSTSLGSGNFGALTSAHDPRILQLGVRFTF